MTTRHDEVILQEWEDMPSPQELVTILTKAIEGRPRARLTLEWRDAGYAYTEMTPVPRLVLYVPEYWT